MNLLRQQWELILTRGSLEPMSSLFPLYDEIRSEKLMKVKHEKHKHLELVLS